MGLLLRIANMVDKLIKDKKPQYKIEGLSVIDDDGVTVAELTEISAEQLKEYLNL